MENFFARYKNPLVLMAVLFIQVVALATQVKRPDNARAANSGGGTRLIRVWTVTAFTPIEKLFVSTGHFFRDSWHNYADLRGVRQKNHELQEEVSRLQMEQVRLKQDAEQARRLQALLEFKEKTITRTVAAQVIGTSGTEQSHVIYIDKGSHDGIRQDMAVITPDGIVGKIKDVFRLSSQVLLINDHDSGAGVILESSRLQGILKGTSLGELQISDVMSDEKVEAGEHVITSGGDRIFPKGFPVGTVVSAVADRDNDPFLLIRIKPAADLRRLEEVMVVTETAEVAPAAASGTTPLRAADILSQRLPSIPKQDANAPKTSGGTATPAATPAGGADQTKKPAGMQQEGVQQKKETVTANEGVKPPSAGAGAAKSPTPVGKPAAGGAAGTGKSGVTKPAGETKTPGTSQTPSTGAATPTPTPKATPRKPKPPANATETPEGATPEQPQAAPTPSPTPSATLSTNRQRQPR
jgi:rod shape-determining protein MreC